MFTTQGQPLGEAVPRKRGGLTEEQTGPGLQTDNGRIRQAGCNICYRERQAERHESHGEMAAGQRQGGVSRHVQGFFSSLGARFGRIRKTTKGTPSTQLYTYKKEKLQELEQQFKDERINLFFGDGSFVCTEGYVHYGWQFPWENITIPSEKKARLNIWGMVDYYSITMVSRPWKV